MEVAEDLKVERTWAEVIELRHPLADYLFAYMPTHNMAIIIELVHGVPYGNIYTGTVELSAESLLTLLEAKRERKRREDVCIAKHSNVIYLYLPERGYFAKFTDGELEYDIGDVSEFHESIYPLEDVVVVDELKQICK